MQLEMKPVLIDIDRHDLYQLLNDGYDSWRQFGTAKDQIIANKVQRGLTSAELIDSLLTHGVIYMKDTRIYRKTDWKNPDFDASWRIHRITLETLRDCILRSMKEPYGIKELSKGFQNKLEVETVWELAAHHGQIDYSEFPDVLTERWVEEQKPKLDDWTRGVKNIRFGSIVTEERYQRVFRGFYRHDARWKRDHARFGLGYHQNGRLIRIGFFQRGGLRRGIEFYPSGKLMFIGRYNDRDHSREYYGPPYPERGLFFTKDGNLLYHGKVKVGFKGNAGWPYVAAPKDVSLKF